VEPAMPRIIRPAAGRIQRQRSRRDCSPKPPLTSGAHACLRRRWLGVLRRDPATERGPSRQSEWRARSAAVGRCAARNDCRAAGRRPESCHRCRRARVGFPRPPGLVLERCPGRATPTDIAPATACRNAAGRSQRPAKPHRWMNAKFERPGGRWRGRGASRCPRPNRSRRPNPCRLAARENILTATSLSQHAVAGPGAATATTCCSRRD
jgi:hypothetical protein